MKKLAICLMFFALVIFPCTLRAATISTTFASNNGTHGNMFDLENVSANPVSLTGYFEGNFQTGAHGEVYMWYRSGTYAGHDTMPEGWSLLGTAHVASAGLDHPTGFNVGKTLLVAPHDVFGMFMYFVYDGNPDYAAVWYTNGSTTYTDGTLSLTAGVGKGVDVNFSTSPGEPPLKGYSVGPRIWNGTIEYTAVPIPAALFLFAPGLLGMVALRRKLKK